ncbi:hypothetical protein [Deinococcus misasensis]|uniref:hypothetical protein n=1 Tax=Deinococcus misasensis TaxID=392413 RepID=UPI00055124BD|nr:hypothetical protein [Deinococcus misasensis]
MKTRPIGVRSDLYDILSVEAQQRNVSISVVANEKLQQALTASNGKQDNEKAETQQQNAISHEFSNFSRF